MPGNNGSHEDSATEASSTTISKGIDVEPGVEPSDSSFVFRDYERYPELDCAGLRPLWSIVVVSDPF